MEVSVYDVMVDEALIGAHGIRSLPLDDLLSQSDFISIHGDLNPRTKGLIGSRELGLMKKTACLINTARGGSSMNRLYMRPFMRDGLQEQAWILPPVRKYSSIESQIALFRSLFRGRDDVYPVRWEGKKGNSGYSPACANEWNRTFCGKSIVKCAVGRHWSGEWRQKEGYRFYRHQPHPEPQS
ncbi:MAG: hypothetical protein FJ117_11920 [Deltaproteobacteria bacterium]|nr:hypothetical protein [Deltaproteobacteria bacterium]